MMQTYIVYTGKGVKDEATLLSLYKSMLQEVEDSNAAPRTVLHHYKRSFGGFVVKLTKEEADRMAELDGVVSVFPDAKKQTPHDKYYRIDADKTFTREKHLKYSPRDTEGHGTHTASTAAGNLVSGASMLGLGQGTSRGGATSARIAVYKVCWDGRCNIADILAAFDDAIADGVDILSASIGGDNYMNYFSDGLSIAAFHAMKNGIVAVFSAGNSGPTPAIVENLSPWSIAVAASTLDRKFVTKVDLGDNRTFEGVSVNTLDLKGELYPIIYGGDAPNIKAGKDESLSRYCLYNSLDPNLVKGKIVLCEGERIGMLRPPTLQAGAVGFLLQGQRGRDTSFSCGLPGSYLELKDGVSVYDYIKFTSDPTATIFKSNEVIDTLAPEVASFSSRGPNLATHEILKPDLIAPGVDIIASWSPVASVSETLGDKRKLQFNIISGTSMSCPHVSGAAAYIKSFHPAWSPAAIRSALITTGLLTQNMPIEANFHLLRAAKPMRGNNNRDAEFACGAGQIDPSKAVKPGLVYDAGESDYVRFLCGQGYSSKMLQLITGDNSSCTSETTYRTARDLNYPSFALQAKHGKTNVGGSFYRTVTNVGSPTSTYKATVTAPEGLKIQVIPSVVSFTSLGQKRRFVLSIDGAIDAAIVSGSLVWDDGEFQVRSPIIVFDLPTP
ncbi:hypothetical protein Fmac_031057 [Flemingia macrophylla]|uniref:Cucumisin n=1 Tax=Flemingia macrophylla TaxID=520843 RepID=A0ABD1L0Z0_9FABA